MSIDWSDAPEDCVGALVAKVGNYHFPKVTFVKEVIHEPGRVKGKSCEGVSLCAYLEVWAWEDRPWNGEGLPPVGVECIVTPNNTIWGFSIIADYQCKVLAYHDDFVWVDLAGVPGVPIATRTDKVDFKPIRTPEQIAAYERESGIKQLIEDTRICNPGVMWRQMAETIYDAGYRKQARP